MKTEIAPSSLLPRLRLAEWIVYGLLAAALSVTNIYTTLLTGWGDGGSLIAVLAAVLLLGVVTRRKPDVTTLNLGQTMASAGGTVGFSVTAYAAIKMTDPDFHASTPALVVLFVALALIGTVVGASVRRYMVKYYFPSGTACAVIQRTVSNPDPALATRPVTILGVFGLLSFLVTLPTKITFKAGGHALLRSWTFHADKGIGLSSEPLLYGIGLVVGPRIGLGMMMGAVGSIMLIPVLQGAGVPEAQFGDWVKWMAISVLTLPSFATIAFAYVFRAPSPTVSGFNQGETHYPPSQRLGVGLVALMIVGTLGAAIMCDLLFALPWTLSVLTVGIAWPLCVMNGRVTGDTDINPVRLVAIVLLSAFAWFLSGHAIALLGMAIIGGTLAGMGVDMMQDYRTGYLLDQNPHHQTVVQVFGSIAGALVAVPFIVYLGDTFGFGEGTGFAAPGGQIWSAMAKAFAGGSNLSSELITAIVIVSLVFSVVAAFNVWPKTAPYMPSLFGIGLGLLLPFEMCAAIFTGGMIKWVATLAYTRGKSAEEQPAALEAAGNDTMLVGSAIFAASAVAAIFVILVAEGLGWWHVAH